MPSTGQWCEIGGLYLADCDCNSKAVLSGDAPFPRCMQCEQAVTWVLLQAITGVPTEQPPTGSKPLK